MEKLFGIIFIGICTLSCFMKAREEWVEWGGHRSVAIICFIMFIIFGTNFLILLFSTVINNQPTT